MAAFKRITDRFSVAAQLGPDDIAQARAQGFAAIIANRPDGEEPGAMTLAEGKALAEAAGLRFHAVPFTMPPPADAVEKVGQILSGEPGPVLAYCRSGTRSATAWAMATARAGTMGTAEIIAAAKAAGYDLTGLAGALESLRPKA